MLGLNENYAAPNAESRGLSLPTDSGGVVEAKRVKKTVRVLRIQQGAEVYALLVDGQNRLLLVAAIRLTDALEELVNRATFGEGGGASRCSVLETCLAAGYVIAGYSAAEWLTKEARLLIELRPLVASVLFSEPGAIDLGVGK